MLSSELISCLSHIDRLKLVLLPEGEKFLCDSKRCAHVMDRDWSTFTQLLQDRLQVFLGLKFFTFEICVSNLNRLHFRWSELLSFICDFWRITIKKLSFVILDKQV